MHAFRIHFQKQKQKEMQPQEMQKEAIFDARRSERWLRGEDE